VVGRLQIGHRQVKILSVTAHNFLTVGSKCSPLSLDSRGLLLIQGENQDDPSAKSNGAGKSSFPDALCWALYGVTARGVTGDAVVNEKAKKDCCVIVVLQDGDIVYKIERYRKHKTFKNSTIIVMWPTVADF
jgi:DNA repair exonuclease SbcCD ATPase subunit